jgi:hypothetical protein
MRAQKTHFEQIPVELVKRIAQLENSAADESEDNDVSDVASDATPLRNAQATDKLASPARRSWREVALEVMQERDPARMIALCKELDGALLDEEWRKINLRLGRKSKPTDSQ